MRIYARLTFQVKDGDRTRQVSISRERELLVSKASTLASLMFKAVEMGALPEKNMYFEFYKCKNDDERI